MEQPLRRASSRHKVESDSRPPLSRRPSFSDQLRFGMGDCLPEGGAVEKFIWRGLDFSSAAKPLKYGRICDAIQPANGRLDFVFPGGMAAGCAGGGATPAAHSPRFLAACSARGTGKKSGGQGTRHRAAKTIRAQPDLCAQRRDISFDQNPGRLARADVVLAGYVAD